MPTVEYSSEVCCPYAVAHYSLLEDIQNRTVGFIKNMIGGETSISDKKTKYGLIPHKRQHHNSNTLTEMNSSHLMTTFTITFKLSCDTSQHLQNCLAQDLQGEQDGEVIVGLLTIWLYGTDLNPDWVLHRLAIENFTEPSTHDVCYYTCSVKLFSIFIILNTSPKLLENKFCRLYSDMLQPFLVKF